MLKRLMNLPFSVAGRAARAFQVHEDEKIRAKFGASVDPGTVAVGGPPVVASGAITAEEVQVDVATLRGWIASKRLVEFLDVRTDAERSAIPGVAGALAMPMDSIGVRVSEIVPDALVVAYCTDGRRATEAVRFFRERGMEDTFALTGGLVAWMRSSE